MTRGALRRIRSAPLHICGCLYENCRLVTPLAFNQSIYSTSVFTCEETRSRCQELLETGIRRREGSSVTFSGVGAMGRGRICVRILALSALASRNRSVAS